MVSGTSVWFSIGKGPLLQAANRLLQGLAQERQSGELQGGYRIGLERKPNNQTNQVRAIEIVFGDENEAFAAQMKFG